MNNFRAKLSAAIEPVCNNYYIPETFITMTANNRLQL